MENRNEKAKNQEKTTVGLITNGDDLDEVKPTGDGELQEKRRF
ncbi:MAG: hypothetical protein PF904_20000 [Kiritimatiellae bacterium]|jgi:hypothetical protein|nr:hypothetical protein [Kiritimatiellia bacterium]